MRMFICINIYLKKYQQQYILKSTKRSHALLAKTWIIPLGMVSLKYLKICFKPLQQRCIWNTDQGGLSRYRTCSWYDKKAREGIRGNRHVFFNFLIRAWSLPTQLMCSDKITQLSGKKNVIFLKVTYQSAPSPILPN